MVVATVMAVTAIIATRTAAVGTDDRGSNNYTTVHIIGLKLFGMAEVPVDFFIRLGNCISHCLCPSCIIQEYLLPIFRLFLQEDHSLPDPLPIFLCQGGQWQRQGVPWHKHFP